EQPDSAPLDTLRRLITAETSGRRLVVVEYVLTGDAAVMVVARDGEAEPSVRRVPFDTPGFSRWARATFGHRGSSSHLDLFFVDGRGREMQDYARSSRR